MTSPLEHQVKGEVQLRRQTTTYFYPRPVERKPPSPVFSCSSGTCLSFSADSLSLCLSVQNKFVIYNLGLSAINAAVFFFIPWLFSPMC